MRMVNLLAVDGEPRHRNTDRSRSSGSIARVAVIVAAGWIAAAVLHRVILGLEISASEQELAWQLESSGSAIELIGRCQSIESTLKQINDFRGGVPAGAALALMTHLMPDGVGLTSIEISRVEPGNASAAKRRYTRSETLTISVSGVAEGDADIAMFIAALTESPYLRAVRTREPTSRQALHGFRIEMDMGRPSSVEMSEVSP